MTDLHTAANRLLKAWDLNDLIHEHIEALRQAIANEALDKMAENARELGLGYEPARCAPAADGVCESLDCPNHKPAQQQEPVGYAVPTFDFDNSVIKKVHYEGTVPLYTSPQPAQRTWVGLTDEEMREIYKRTDWDMAGGWEYERAIEAKLKEKNT